MFAAPKQLHWTTYLAAALELTEEEAEAAGVTFDRARRRILHRRDRRTWKTRGRVVYTAGLPYRKPQ